MLVGGLLVALEVLLCEKWCLHAFCGIYGGKRMTEVLRTVRGHWRSLRHFYSILRSKRIHDWEVDLVLFFLRVVFSQS
jgi:hypothetical protein